jgi:hypothetical protein
MDNEKTVSGPILEEAVERLDDDRRQLLKLALAGAAVFTVPLMASFSMNSLLSSPALATAGNMDPGNMVTEN